MKTAAHDPESEGKYCTLSSSRQKKPIPLPSVELDCCTFLYRAPLVAAVSKVRTFGGEVTDDFDDSDDDSEDSDEESATSSEEESATSSDEEMEAVKTKKTKKKA